MMFRSIKWRLTISFILLTFLTASVIAGLAFGLMQQYIERQQHDILESNAQVVAQQAKTLMWPVVQLSDLQSLASTMAYLGNVQVSIKDLDGHILADSGSVRQSYQFLWILPSTFMDTQRGMGWEFRTMIMPILEPEHMGNMDELFTYYQLPSGAAVRIIRRENIPWGSHIEFQPEVEREEVELTQDSGPVIQVPIVESGLELGYVEVTAAADFGKATLRSMLYVFSLATAGAVLVSGIAGYLLSLQLSRPINKLSNAATLMGEGDLSIRAPHLGGGEIGHLSNQFNTMADTLQASFEKLEDERDTLRRFVADASHELRTPITALNNFNALLLDKKDMQESVKQEFLAESKVQIQRLSWITENLLNLSRLDAGINGLNLQPVKINELINSTAAPYQYMAKESGIDFVVNISPDVNVVQLDRTLIELAVSNLLDNAFKFTPAENGLIELTVESVDDQIKISVQDNGIGIAEDDLDHVFDRFYRGSNLSVEGSGLGLALVKSVVEAHGGSVGVNSTFGVGSCFHILLKK